MIAMYCERNFLTRKFFCVPALLTLVWTLSVVASGYAGQGQPPAGKQTESLVEKAIKLSGIANQLDNIPESLVACFSGDALPDQRIRQSFESRLRKDLSAKDLTACIHNSLIRNFDPYFIEGIIVFYESSLGRRVAHIQREALNPVLLRAVKEARKSVLSLEDKRLENVKRIVKAENLLDVNNRLLISFVRGLALSTTGNGKNDETLQQTDIDEQFPQIVMSEESASELALVSTAYTFRSLSDADIEKLAEHWESDEGKWFSRSLSEGVDEIAHRSGTVLGSILKDVKAKDDPKANSVK
jgi:hypothetical protein